MKQVEADHLRRLIPILVAVGRCHPVHDLCLSASLYVTFSWSTPSVPLRVLGRS